MNDCVYCTEKDLTCEECLKGGENMESRRFSLNGYDFSRILVGASVAMGGALLTYLSETVGQIEWGDWTPVVVALASILVNMGRKFIAGK